MILSFWFCDDSINWLTATEIRSNVGDKSGPARVVVHSKHRLSTASLPAWLSSGWYFEQFLSAQECCEMPLHEGAAFQVLCNGFPRHPCCGTGDWSCSSLFLPVLLSQATCLWELLSVLSDKGRTTASNLCDDLAPLWTFVTAQFWKWICMCPL